jgi:hypothetical protein
LSRSQNTCGVTHYTAILNDGRLQLDCRATPARPRQSTPRVNQQTLASVNQHRHHHSCRDILNLIVARLSSRLSRHIHFPEELTPLFRSRVEFAFALSAKWKTTAASVVTDDKAHRGCDSTASLLDPLS